MKRILAACILLTANAAYYDNARDYSYSSLLTQEEGAWLLLEKLIITRPKNNVTTFFGKKGATLLTSGGAGILCYSATKHLAGDSSLSKACSLGAGALSTLLTYHGIKNYLLQKEEHRQLTKLMKHWSKIKDKLPQEVLKALANLHATWVVSQEAYEEQADAVLTFLKVELHGRYPYKYRNESESLMAPYYRGELKLRSS